MLSSDRINKIKELLQKLNIDADDYELFNEALTHPSYNFEKNIQDGKDYERLEFLGDSVLRLVMSDYLYEKFHSYDEGKLTKIRSWLVSDRFLFNLALELGLDEYINIGEHEAKDGGRKKESILACAMEAFFGAIYKNRGFSQAEKFIQNIYDNSDFDEQEILYSYNSKEILQQYTQSKNKDLPEYILVKETGLAHNKTYEVMVMYENTELGRGIAKTKKDAEKNAAYNAVKMLGLIGKKENG